VKDAPSHPQFSASSPTSITARRRCPTGLLEYTSTITKRVMTDQHLDSMDLEKERGITIKMHPVTMNYPAKDGKIYKLKPYGHAGPRGLSPYEVLAPSLAACEGAAAC